MAGSGPDLKLETGQFSHPGRKRTNNEDWLGTFQPEDARLLAAKGSLFLVADGMGGHRSGETASRQAVDHIIRAYLEDPATDVATSLQQAIESANAALHADKRDPKEGRHRGTTLVAAVIRQGRLWIANVGDSRAYLLHRGKLQQISQDHSWASAGAQAGMAEGWVGRNIITRALGIKPKVEVDIFAPIKLAVSDQVLLCTDGLTTPLSDAEIQEITRHRRPQQAAEELVQAANTHGGPDNVSVILIQVVGQGSWAAQAGQFLSALMQGETWSEWAHWLFSGKQNWRSPAVILSILFFALALIALGFALGLILFGH